MKNTQIITIAACLLILVACGQDTEQMVVGWSGPLSGDYAIIGIENLRGVQLALDEINDSRFVLLSEDDQFDEKRTMTAYQKMRQVNDVSALLTVTYGGVLALAQEAETGQVVVIDSLDTSEEIADAGEGVFGIGVYDEGIGFTLADFAAHGLQSKNAGILYNNADPFMLLVVQAFKERYSELTGLEVKTEQYMPEENDFRTQLLKLNDVDTLVIIGFDEAGLVLKQARTAGIQAPVLAIDTSTSAGFKANAGDAYEDLYFTSWSPADKDKETAFLAKYKAKFGQSPDQLLFAATGYDAMHVLARSLQVSTEYDLLKNELYSIKNYSGLTGMLAMSEDGISRSVREEMYQVRNGVPIKVN